MAIGAKGKVSIDVIDRGTGTYEVLTVDGEWPDLNPRESISCFLPGYLGIRDGAGDLSSPDYRPGRRVDGVEVLHSDHLGGSAFRCVVLVFWRDGEDPS